MDSEGRMLRGVEAWDYCGSPCPAAGELKAERYYEHVLDIVLLTFLRPVPIVRQGKVSLLNAGINWTTGTSAFFSWAIVTHTIMTCHLR